VFGFMDRTVFVDTEADPKWWLLQLELEYSLTELRKDIGSHAGWGRDYQWYLEKWKLEELYDRIERHDGSLLHELDDATDEYKRQAWITKIVELLNPAQPEDPAPAAEPAPPAPSAPAAAAAPPAAEEPKKPSPFKKKEAKEAAPTSPEMHEQLESAVKDALSHIEGDKLAGLASELGITEAELATIVKDLPADFEKLVAAEAAKLAAAPTGGK
jgi:hypothetical protein